jgi:hypothetical protein
MVEISYQSEKQFATRVRFRTQDRILSAKPQASGMLQKLAMGEEFVPASPKSPPPLAGVRGKN